MLRIDFYVQHLVRHQADAVILSSGTPVKFAFPTGERQSKQPIDHAQIEQLVQEAAPPRAMTEVKSAGRTRFQHQGPGIEVTVSIEAKSASVWDVRITPGKGSEDVGIDAGIELGGGLGTDDDSNVFERPIGGAMQGSAGIVENPGTAAPSPAAAPAPPAAPAAAPAPARKPRGVPNVTVAGEPAINTFLRMMVQEGASDVHLSSTVEPMWRLDGSMQRLPGRPAFSPEELGRILQEILPARCERDWAEKWDTDFAHNIDGCARFRANYFMDRKGPGAVFRQIPFEILGWEKLGLPKGVIDLCYLTKGLVVVTGPTGSGKSTTLASLIDYVNDHREDHIITIEDPIEFVHPNKKCLVNQREVGTHTKGFKQALRAALREDPDIVLVGEMRDLETVAIAIETAETGHLVFGTLHTTSAKSTVDRVIDQFPADRQEQIRVMLSESLRGVISQVLCKKKGGGRVAAYEVMITNNAVSNLIREGKTFQLTSVMQTGKRQGMQTMNDHLMEHVKNGLVEPQEAYMKSNDKATMKSAFEKMNIKLDL